MATMADVVTPKGNIIRVPVGTGTLSSHATALNSRTYNAKAKGRVNNRADLVTGEIIDLREVAAAYNSDSYVRAAFSRYAAMITEQGWSVRGENEDLVDYVNMRIFYIEKHSGRKMWQIMYDVTHDMLQYSNAYIEKVQRIIKLPNGKKRRFTIGYQLIDPVDTRPVRNEKGKILWYEQLYSKDTPWRYNVSLGDLDSKWNIKWGMEGQNVKWKPDKIIHLYHDKPSSAAIGIPIIWQAIEDIKGLRRMEENVEMLVYRHAIPLLHYALGSKERPCRHTSELIEHKQNFESATIEGTIFTDERAAITPIEVTTLDFSKYLEHYRNRIFAALGMSGVMMGESVGGSRDASQVVSVEAKNTAVSFQTTIMRFVNEFIIRDLIREGVDEDFIFDEDDVYMYSGEVDFERRQNDENHIANLITTNINTITEGRAKMGLKPLTPEEEEDMYFHKFGAGALEEIKGDVALLASKVQPENQYKKLNAKPLVQRNSEEVHLKLDELDQTDSLTTDILCYNEIDRDIYVLLSMCYAVGLPLEANDIILSSSDNKAKVEQLERLIHARRNQCL